MVAVVVLVVVVVGGVVVGVDVVVVVGGGAVVVSLSRRARIQNESGAARSGLCRYRPPGALGLVDGRMCACARGLRCFLAGVLRLVVWLGVVRVVW